MDIPSVFSESFSFVDDFFLPFPIIYFVLKNKVFIKKQKNVYKCLFTDMPVFRSCPFRQDLGGDDKHFQEPGAKVSPRALLNFSILRVSS